MNNILALFATSVCKCVETSLFGRVCSTGDGTEIFAILSIVVQVLTAGIGILAVIGIVYFGIQYLTAGDDPGKVKKAKSRLLAIVIGLASYAVIYAALYFLLPNFNPKLDANFQTCTESEPEPENPITPPTPPDPGDDEDDEDDEDEPETGDRSPYCGPENPGTYKTLTSVSNKNNAPGANTNVCYKYNKDTGKFSNYSGCITKKYTTSWGRTYYVFRQANADWAKIYINAGHYMTNYGCKRTSLATVLRSFGANVDPSDFSKSNFSSKASSIASENSLKMTAYSNKSTSTLISKTWEALTAHGAAIIHATKEPFTGSGSHYIPLVDYRLRNGKMEVYMANPVASRSSKTTAICPTKISQTGWVSLECIAGSSDGVTTFIPTKDVNCNTTGSTPDDGDSGDPGGSDSTNPGWTSTPTVKAGSFCGPESAGTKRNYTNPSSINKSVDGSSTKKYTTTTGRVYYIFRQNDSVWGDLPAESKTLSSNGGPRTLLATILRSFGANLTPAYFSGGTDTSFSKAITRAKELVTKNPPSLKLNISNEITSNFKSTIMSTIQNGGAVIIKTGKNGIFSGLKSSYLALLDIEKVGNSYFVFLADSYGASEAKKDGTTIKINALVKLEDVIDYGKLQSIWTFNPTKTDSCSPTNTPTRPEDQYEQ